MDLSLDEKQLEIIAQIRDFTETHVKPVSMEIDQIRIPMRLSRLISMKRASRSGSRVSVSRRSMAELA